MARGTKAQRFHERVEGIPQHRIRARDRNTGTEKPSCINPSFLHAFDLKHSGYKVELFFWRAPSRRRAKACALATARRARTLFLADSPSEFRVNKRSPHLFWQAPSRARALPISVR